MNLSRLIFLCIQRHPEDNFILWFSDQSKIWVAGFYRYGQDNYVDDYPYPSKSGATPEEAVNNLLRSIIKNENAIL